MPMRRVKVGRFLLPKFKLSFSAGLNQALRNLGIQAAFTCADLGDMLVEQEPLCLDQVLHKAVIEVNERHRGGGRHYLHNGGLNRAVGRRIRLRAWISWLTTRSRSLLWKSCVSRGPARTTTVGPRITSPPVATPHHLSAPRGGGAEAPRATQLIAVNLPLKPRQKNQLGTTRHSHLPRLPVAASPSTKNSPRPRHLLHSGHGGRLRARGGGRPQAHQAPGPARRRTGAAPARGHGEGGGPLRARGGGPPASRRAHGVRRRRRPGRRRQPRRAQLPAARVRPRRPARAHPTPDARGGAARRRRRRARGGHPPRALVGPLHQPQPRLRLPRRRANGESGAEVTVGKRSYNTHVYDVEDDSAVKISKLESGGLLKQELFSLTIPQVGGGEDIFATIRWSQNLLYDNGQFSVEVPFCFPPFVNPPPKLFKKKEKIHLALNPGVSKEVLLQGTSHPLKEKGRQGEKLSFLHDAVVENWSVKDFTFTYSVYSGDLSGGVLVQPSTLRDYDERDMFCLFLLPGNNENRKVFRKAVVFIIDTSGSMQGKPLENIKNAVSIALSNLVQGDYFNIISFNDELHSFSSCLEQVNEKTIESATEWMNLNFIAKGGTDIMHPLSEAMVLLSNSHEALPQIYLVTDGSVDNERNICLTVKNELMSRGSKSPRISTFGLGSYCNHYFLRMLASIGKGHYDAAFDTGSIENRMLQWFQKASSTVVTNVSIDAIKYIKEFEVDSEYILDISAKDTLCVSGRYHGQLPETLTVKGHLADTSEISIELKVQHIKAIPLDKVLAKQQLDHLTAKAWLSENKQLERKAVKLSIQNSIPSEYTRMVLVQSSLDRIDPSEQAKKKPAKQSSPDEGSVAPLRGLTLGFGDLSATRDNLTAGFGDFKAPEKFEMFEKAVGCCGRLADCFCCMCFIKACSKMNDQCAVVMVQVCAAFACLGCFECCSELCCGGSD